MKSTSSETGDDSGKITSDQLVRLLRRVLPTKTEHAFSKLSKVSIFVVGILIHSLLAYLS
jgi:hypothetical protein